MNLQTRSRAKSLFCEKQSSEAKSMQTGYAIFITIVVLIYNNANSLMKNP